MYHSSEIRWFGNKRKDLSAIYDAIEAPNNIQDKNREDYYLLTGVDNLGIKLRQDIVEMKWRIKNNIPIDGFSGSGEKWIKAGLKIQDQLNIQSYLKDTGYNWAGVKKFRQQKKFAVQDDRIVPIRFEDNAKEGCFVEFTEITINKKIYYSFNLEAFGSVPQTSNNLKRTIAFLESKLVPEILNNYSCCSYPVFLKQTC